MIGQDLHDKISVTAIKLYQLDAAADYALKRGLILVDTKFEFGLVPSPSSGEELILVDDLLTPDSSRYWPAEGYKPGGTNGFESGPEGKEGEGWVMETSVVEGTRERYLEALRMLVGEDVTL
ncbi:uncharacterized protein B0H18DRAFT_1208167 [Fomitopsis serialis]|uniref:uncharacterized protein n=1 Tax=Fomitopsis serialis TaxID=139415 RepID=UPI002007B1CD|nr:uncharacterized protein B0H18DRAFT_1208167 [Neoantrodia serialis]KAH9933463.1 hypothetical protein B0H18DRAFT_1208167 [Neoantrodia serialis]